MTTTQQVRDIILEIAQVIDGHKQALTDLDAAIGDGDHGHNMARGFQAVTEKLRDAEPGIENDLKATAMALISNVGGASGPLYGTLFLKGAAAAKDADAVDLTMFAQILGLGIKGVQMRGKAVFGEKTMLDVLIPVQESVQASAKAGEDGLAALERAVAVARECVEKTKDIIATKGRASYLGERSLGHIDPGAMSSFLMIETIANCVKGA